MENMKRSVPLGRVGALLLDGVLCGEDHEGRGERMGLSAGRYRTLSHGLQERRLSLRWAVDLVREQQVVNAGPFMNPSRSPAALSSCNLGTRDVRGIRSAGAKLVERRRPSGRGVSWQTGHTDEQAMAARKRADERRFDTASPLMRWPRGLQVDLGLVDVERGGVFFLHGVHSLTTWRPRRVEDGQIRW